jgi:ketopantoate reductase
MKKTTLIYGGGAIGSFLAACLYKSNHKIFFLCRKKNYSEIKKNGLKINLYDNKILLKKINLRVNKNFILINSLTKAKKIKFDNIFITTKITSSLKNIFLDIEKFISEKTLLITPCTSIPFWWYLCLKKKFEKKFEKKLDRIFVKNIKRKNLVGMTMWLSGKILKPGQVNISHIQRGFPIKEVFAKNKVKVSLLRKDISKTCFTPKVKNIFSEIFIKSINSLAFNLIALKYEQNNYELKKNIKAKKEVLKMLREGDEILKKNEIKIYQSPISRLNQTLKSTSHTMSMLFAYKTGNKIEIRELWKSFDQIIKIIHVKMTNTEKNFKFIEKKLYEII